MTSYEMILESLKTIKIINTHEHLINEEERLSHSNDIFSLVLCQYGSTDLVSSGMSIEDMKYVQKPGGDLDRKWQLLKPYWENVQNTSYFEAINRMCKELYGHDRLAGDNYHQINQAMLKNEKPGLYKEILTNKCNCATTLNDMYKDGPYNVDLDIITPILNSNRFILPVNYRDNSIENIASEYDGYKVESIDDWSGLINYAVKRDCDKFKAVAMKIGVAYRRTLKVSNPDKSEVAGIFSEILRGHNVSAENYALFQDYATHQIIKASTENDLTIQIHTGIQEGNGNYLENSNPLLLTNLFMEYPETRFDLLHGSYPFDKEVGSLVKMFPNVRINMAWSHIISRNFAVNALIQWLDLIPVNKIFAFGGDVLCPEYSYAGLLIAKENVAKALAYHVDNGKVTIEWAIRAGEKMFFDNPNSFYRLNYKVTGD